MPTGATLYWTQREMELVLCVSRLGRIMVLETQGMWTWVGMKDCESNRNLDSVCRTDFGERGELVVCEELARFLQKTYYRRLTAYGIWRKGIGSRLSKSGSGKKSKAVVRNGRKRRSTTRSRSLRVLILLFRFH